MIEVGEFREGMPLSELIQLAVNDARKALETGAYELDGAFWHEPDSDGVCRICLAGGVIAGTLKYDAGACSFGCDFDEWGNESLEALDDVRTGDIDEALDRLGTDWQQHELVVFDAGHLIENAFDRDTAIAPLETYEAAAQILAEVGL